MPTGRGSGPRPRHASRTSEEEVEGYKQALEQLESIQTHYARLVDNLMADLEAEKARSEALLRNVLPERIIERLNHGEELIADRFEDVAVVFGDLVGFTEVSSTLEAPVVVTTLNQLFKRFDAACVEFGVEKIKTIGDAYLAVAGLTDDRPGHVEAAVQLALAMRRSLDEVNAETGHGWQMRIGIHAGPAVAGIIGTQKYVYDVWGDTVNVASRLETSAEPDRIHMTRDLAERLGPNYTYQQRGTVDLKGKGLLETCYLLDRARPGGSAVEQPGVGAGDPVRT